MTWRVSDGLGTARNKCKLWVRKLLGKYPMVRLWKIGADNCRNMARCWYFSESILEMAIQDSLHLISYDLPNDNVQTYEVM
jgi:hypothetical protein